MAIHDNRKEIRLTNENLQYQVMQGEKFESVKVFAKGKDGDGLGRLPNGMIAIIQDKRLEIGNKVDIEIVRVKEKIAFARLS